MWLRVYVFISLGFSKPALVSPNPDPCLYELISLFRNEFQTWRGFVSLGSFFFSVNILVVRWSSSLIAGESSAVSPSWAPWMLSQIDAVREMEIGASREWKREARSWTIMSLGSKGAQYVESMLLQLPILGTRQTWFRHSPGTRALVWLFTQLLTFLGLVSYLFFQLELLKT